MIKLICIGKVKESWIKEGIEEFVKRISAFARFEVVEIKDSNKEKEANEISSKIKNEKVFLFDEKGKEYSSPEFSQFLKTEIMNTKDIAFVIGGPEGLSEQIKSKYPRIALSKMTFTHEMARLFFIEQLYRAFMINNNRSYHK
jgi:23S rRNA (pseudouridine1915-N3)-methyltransferase